MFKRGGSSYQSQGTGITSPYDTPRKRYAEGPTWEEINERRSNIFQPRSEMSFAAEGFGALGAPYKKSGDAKTMGEMLHEGATSVRASRAQDKALGQSVDLANIESDADRLSLEEKHARDLELIDKQGKSTLLKDPSIPRQVEAEQTSIIKGANANPQNPGSNFDLVYSGGIAQGRVTIRNLQTGDEVITAMVIPSSAFKKIEGQWDFDIAQLAEGMVYWNPMTMRWLIVENAQTSLANEIYFDSYEAAKGGSKVKKVDEATKKSLSENPDASDKEIKNNEITMKITSNLKDVDITDKSVIYDEAQKIGIKIVENPGGSKTWLQDLADNEMSIFAFTEILKKKKMKDTYGHVSSNKAKRGNVFDQVTEEIKVAEMATGGRAGYASGTEPDDLSELTSWWKSEVDNSFNS
mgnify:FL=1